MPRYRVPAVQVPTHMQYTAAVALPILRIRVVPDETAPVPEPLVLLSERDVAAPASPSRIIWRKMPASKKFRMIDLEDLTGKDVFRNIEVHKKRVECDFVPPAGDPAGSQYDYRLIIRYKGIEYDTDDRIGPAGGKAVIRN